jgi:hypothetical protein
MTFDVDVVSVLDVLAKIVIWQIKAMEDVTNRLPFMFPVVDLAEDLISVCAPLGLP